MDQRCCSRSVLRTVVALACLLSLAGAAWCRPVPVSAAPRSSACGWSPLGNALFPDLNARYWHVQVPVQPGGQLRITGRFANARYFSYALQGPGGSGDAIHDAALTPDPGSVNPFVVGADRNVTQRSYTLRVVQSAAPLMGRAPNTLYAGSSRMGGSINIVYRIYDVDADVDQATAGVGFPTVQSLDGSGHTTATCSGGIGSVTPAASYPNPPRIPGAGVGAIGTNPPAWQKFVNTATVYSQMLHSQLLGDDVYDRISEAASGGAIGGLGANVDNEYITTFLNPHYGKVLVLRATMPTFPHTDAGQSPMQSGQVRYWSMCSEIPSTTQAVSCIPDHAVPVGSQRSFTVVVSAPADRPRNATALCGVAWLPMSDHPGSVLLMRNLLADPTFAQGIGKAQLNHEAATMGSYYPRGQYLPDAAAFDARGCGQP